MPDGNAVGDEGIGAVEETEGAPMEQLEEAGDERDDRDDCKVWFKGPSNPLTPLTLAGLRVARGLQPLLAAALLNRGTTSLPSVFTVGLAVLRWWCGLALYAGLPLPGPPCGVLHPGQLLHRAEGGCEGPEPLPGVAGIYIALVWWCLHHSNSGSCSSNLPVIILAILTFSELSEVQWYCPCGRKNRKNAWHCPDCRTSWTYGTPAEDQAPQSPRQARSDRGHSYAQTWQWPQEPWVRSTNSAQSRPPSPRQRQGGRGQGRKQRRGKKVQQQAAEQYAPQGYGAQPPLPPPATPPPPASGGQVPMPPASGVAIASAPKAPVLPVPSEEAIKLRSLTQKLKKHQDLGMELPEDVQDDLKDVCIKEAKSQRKTMHLAVNAMDDARQVYDDAVRARAQLHLQWKSFLAESLKLWQGHTTSFQSQEAQLTARIQEAKDAFVQARDALNAAKIEAANMVPVDAKSTVTVSDDEEIKDLKDVPMAAAERIATGLSNLVETMSVLPPPDRRVWCRKSRRAKRPRVQPEQPGVAPSEAAPVGGALASSAPPFGTPGGQ